MLPRSKNFTSPRNYFIKILCATLKHAKNQLTTGLSRSVRLRAFASFASLFFLPKAGNIGRLTPQLNS
jgi:hypothetical protein